ncbi:acyloxyacyl hydrolase [Flavobacterium channae]|uniref:acyloxyacyl hydrolase n=1 Tax=Flavobacterium channae TaxID=2897181 RepID=UPI001E46C791|nr:acyloxyacyl hydrolase [Flavobacterium channae]UGS23019.1 acyloxyacyl hydrolase [Flavobacterium channae]
MRKKIFVALLVFSSLISYSQDSIVEKRWLRIGFVYGFSAQNRIIKQDSDYTYESNAFKLSSQFKLYNKNKHFFEILIEPSYYNSKHESLNPWHDFYTSSDNPDYYRDLYMRMKTINEYVLNLGIIYRYRLTNNISFYALGNVGPMYIDTDTEMLKKGFAFSDIFALGSNYKVGNYSFDLKMMARHVSNLDLQKPNYGLNSFGFEFGTYYEFN